jgi:hypothetical protein
MLVIFSATVPCEPNNAYSIGGYHFISALILQYALVLDLERSTVGCFWALEC